MKPTWQSTRAWVLLLVVLVLGLSLDLTSKSWAFQTVAGTPVKLELSLLILNPHWSPIPLHEGVVVIPNRMLDLRLVLNDGAVFGIGSQQRGFFIFFTFVALCVAGWIFAKHTLPTSKLAHIAIGLILGGGLGNLYDRIMIGRVRDFLYLFPDRHLPFGISWPGGNTELFPWIFNAGDVMLLTGMTLLMIYFWKQPTPTVDSTLPEKSDPAG